MRTLFLFLLLISHSMLVSAQVINVPADQLTIQDGLNAASFGDTVLVAPGTYFENITWPNVNGIKLIAEGDTSDTFIDGSALERVIHIQGHTIDTLTFIEGFTIRNGRGIGIFNGSGIFCDSSSVFINYCRVTNNSGANGAGIAFLNSNSIVENSTIDKNLGSWTMNSGTGMLAVNHSDIYVRNCKIAYNSASFDLWKAFGIGVNLQSGSKAHFVNSEISHNRVQFTESGESRGIGIYISGPSELYMYNCSVNANLSSSPVVYNRGAAINAESAGKIVLENVEIKDNVAEHATENSTGIVAINCSNTQFKNVVIKENTLKLRTNEFNANRGVLITNGNFSGDGLVIKNNLLIIENSPVEIRGGAMDVGGSGLFELKNSLIVGNGVNAHLSGTSYAGVIKFNGTVLAKLTNTTIADNFNNADENIFPASIDANTTNLTILNSIVYNPNIQSEIEGTNVSVEYSNIKGGFTGTGNIDADPMFFGNGDYRLQTFSPCINSGTTVGAPLTDIEGNPRPMPIGTNPDMGAYEDDNPSTSIAEVEDMLDLNIYPNPTNGIINLNSSLKVIEIRVTDSKGSIVLKRPNVSNQLDLSGLSNGVFTLQIETSEKLLTEKVMLLR